MEDTAQDQNDRGIKLVLEPFSSIEPETVEWVWKDRIPLGKMTILSGDPGLGKSFVCCDLAARVSTGRSFPDGAACTTGEFIILSCEDDKADTIRPRLDAHKAKLSRVHNLCVQTDDGAYAQLDLGKHVGQLQQLMQRHPSVRGIVLDPVTAFMGKIDQNSVTEIRRIFGPLTDFCQEYRIKITR